MIKAKQVEYSGQICKRITDQLTALTPDAIAITEVVHLYLRWGNHSEYNKIVASVDMFFQKFPEHKLSNLRISTTGSRYRDCAALVSYGYLTELFGMPRLTELLEWIFFDGIGNEVDLMIDSDEEIDQDDSYFPYQIDLGLVKRSGYSASYNPLSFELVHLTGALLRSPRSNNARHITDAQKFLMCSHTLSSHF